MRETMISGASLLTAGTSLGGGHSMGWLSLGQGPTSNCPAKAGQSATGGPHGTSVGLSGGDGLIYFWLWLWQALGQTFQYKLI